MIAGLLVEAVFFSLGWIGGRIWVRKQARVYVRLTPVERKVLDYIKSHGCRVRLSACASELGLEVDRVREAIKALRGRIYSRGSSG